MIDLTTLSRMLDKATGPNRELFITARNTLVAGWEDRRSEPEYRDWNVTFIRFVNAEAWTDAALAIMEQVLPGAEFEVSTIYWHARATLPLNSESECNTVTRSDCNIPLAIIRAVVAAKMQEDKR